MTWAILVRQRQTAVPDPQEAVFPAYPSAMVKSHLLRANMHENTAQSICRVGHGASCSTNRELLSTADRLCWL